MNASRDKLLPVGEQFDFCLAAIREKQLGGLHLGERAREAIDEQSLRRSSDTDERGQPERAFDPRADPIDECRIENIDVEGGNLAA
jgi:hypothetical protein